MQKITIADLRDLIDKKITYSIGVHRGSKLWDSEEEYYCSIEDSPTDDEIDEFIFSNALFEGETVELLVDEGFLGFSARIIDVSDKWLDKFKEDIESWVSTNSWLGADGPVWTCLLERKVDESHLWTPSNNARPQWIDSSPSCLLLAADLISKGKLLSEMGWRDFEELIGLLLENEGWKVEVTRATRDGGIDVVAIKNDKLLGEIKSIWQAKKYGPTNKVRLSEVRELSAIREEAKATKAFIVTTSRLTRDAIEWIKRDIYRLGYKEHENVEQWVKEAIFEKDLYKL